MTTLQKILFVLYGLLVLGTGSVLLLGVIGGFDVKNVAGDLIVLLYFAAFLTFAICLKKRSKGAQQLFFRTTKVSLVLHTLLTIIFVYFFVDLALGIPTSESSGIAFVVIRTIAAAFMCVLVLFFLNLYAFPSLRRPRFWVFFLLLACIGLGVGVLSLLTTEKTPNNIIEDDSATVSDTTQEKNQWDSADVASVNTSATYAACASVIKLKLLFTGTSPSDDEIAHSVTVLDEDNAYLTMSPIWMDGSIDCTIFLESDGTSIVAFTIHQCGPICHETRGFYEMRDDVWVDVSSEILPDVDAALTRASSAYDEFNPLFMLPRYGTTIVIIEQYSHDELFRLMWQQGKFTFK